MVTALELARRLGVDPKRFRDWLRAQARAGHPLIGGHVRNSRWEFSPEEADQLAAEFSGDERALSSQPRRQGQSSPSPRRPGRPPEPDRRSKDPGHRVLEVWEGDEVETLADLLRPDLRAVCVGVNPSPVSVSAGHYYQGRVGQGFWQRLRRANVLQATGSGFEDDAAFAAGVGFTDIVKRPTARADGLRDGELERGRAELLEKLNRFRPGLVIFTFKKTAVALLGPFDGHGHRPELEVAGIPSFVMPGPYERADRVDQALKALERLVGLSAR